MRRGFARSNAQVLGRMKQLMVDNNTAASHSFLLDDDSSIPFSLDDIQQLMDDKVPPPTPPSDAPANLCSISVSLSYPPLYLICGDWHSQHSCLCRWMAATDIPKSPLIMAACNSSS